MARYTQITGWGKYLPQKILTNQDLERLVNTSDAWIVSRTGIRERRIAAADETASSMAVRAAGDALEVAGLEMSDIELVVPHQANIRILKSAAKALELPPEKFFINVDRYGNTSAASVPIALCEAVEEGQLKDGDHLVLVGFGGGLSWAAMVLEWGTGKR